MNNNSHQIRHSISTILPRTMEDALRCPPISTGTGGSIPDSDTSDLVNEIMRTNPGFRSALERIQSVTDKHAATKDSPREIPYVPEILNSALCTPNSKDWLDRFNASICSSANLSDLAVRAREPILGQWFHQGDLGFIYGPRGLGKTWLALHLARQCAEGGPVGPWAAPQPRAVLYIDGEMPLDDIRQRDAILSATRSTRMFYLQHEALFHKGGKIFNLALPEVQGAILQLCRQHGIQVLFLDNLSCLFAGLTENGADAWEQVLPWLLNLRRNRIAVVFIAHAGREGTMRGTSRREDAAFWVIHLSEARSQGERPKGAQFVASFEKNRNSTNEECPPILWQFSASGGITWKKPSSLDILRKLVEEGLTSASEIAVEMGVAKSFVSRLAKQGELAGWLAKKGRDYVLVEPSVQGASFAE